jgi:DNA-binding CsgD family transcriptional regulator
MCIYVRPSWVDIATVVLARRSDFGERERTIAELLRPHFSARYRAAMIRRRLDAALDALDREDGDGVLLLERDTVEFASPSARRLLHTYFGATDKMPERLTKWYETDPTQPLTVAQNGSELIVTCANGGSALLLQEQPGFVSTLTPRERDVMRCVAAGLTNAEIAQKLCVEASTVRKHLEHIYDKLGVRSRTAALATLNAKAKLPR